MLRPFLQSTLKRQHEIRRCRRRWNAFRLGPFLCVHQLPRQGPTMCWPDTAATGVMTTGAVRIFRAELARLIKKGLAAGLSNEDMADELIEAAEDLTSNGAGATPYEQDPVGDVIASHRP
jgi:hypothetical protein